MLGYFLEAAWRSASNCSSPTFQDISNFLYLVIRFFLLRRLSLKPNMLIMRSSVNQLRMTNHGVWMM
ncbi:hypothetical protein NECAME_04840 [Necator americanus]|uniref:Uncharacterized protein n=1 Tax=Necator americanus TaxID=51031 RepID=W2SPQ6_NECAM|nr:hypothetical protein NECAME_04840 [Necator americanus]ETN70682.1 hypothetical protein NECAME_04840 [Necator americanus]